MSGFGSEYSLGDMCADPVEGAYLNGELLTRLSTDREFLILVCESPAFHDVRFTRPMGGDRLTAREALDRGISPVVAHDPRGGPARALALSTGDEALRVFRDRNRQRAVPAQILAGAISNVNCGLPGWTETRGESAFYAEYLESR